MLTCGFNVWDLKKKKEKRIIFGIKNLRKSVILSFPVCKESQYVKAGFSEFHSNKKKK